MAEHLVDINLSCTDNGRSAAQARSTFTIRYQHCHTLGQLTGFLPGSHTTIADYPSQHLSFTGRPTPPKPRKTTPIGSVKHESQGIHILSIMKEISDDVL